MFDLDLVKTFITIAEQGSISRAAECLYTSKSVVKKQADTLEAEMGVPLLQRNTKGVTLTSAGEVFVKGAKHMLSEFESLKQSCQLAMKNSGGRTVRVAYYSDIVFPCIQYCSENYMRVYPNDTCEPVSALYNEAYDGIRNNLFDVAFCPRPRAIDSQGLASITTFRTPVGGLVSSSSPLAAKTSLSREDLAQHTVGVLRLWYSQENMAQWSKMGPVTFDIVPLANGIDGMQTICGSGGIFLFPASDAYVYPFYTFVPLEDPFYFTGSLTYSPAATGAVLDYVRETESFMRSRTNSDTLTLLTDWNKNPKEA